MAQQPVALGSGSKDKEIDVWTNYEDFAAAVPFMNKLEVQNQPRHDALIKAHRLEDHITPLIRRFRRREVYEAMSHDEGDSQVQRDSAQRDAIEYMDWLYTAARTLIPKTKARDEGLAPVSKALVHLKNRPAPSRADAFAWGEVWMHVLPAMLGIAIHVLTYYRPNSDADVPLVAKGSPTKPISKEKETLLLGYFTVFKTKLPELLPKK